MARTTTMAALAALTLTASACGSSTSETVTTIDDRPTTSTSTVLLTLPDEEAAETSTTTATTDDPFEVYLTLAPADAPDMTPDDASTRALLGCGTTWPPGTVDAALAEAYATFIAQWKDQGLCGQ